MKNSISLMVKALAFGVAISPALALADYKSEIVSSCSAYQQGKDNSHINACKLYIDGFIDAAILTEAGVVQPQAVIDKNSKKTSAYLKRAYETRLLTTASSLKGEDAHQFCIPLEYDRRALASTLAKTIDINKLPEVSLKEILFEKLITKFPCDNK